MNPRLDDWRGCRVWLVGASAGIGEALAIALARRGAQLILSARRREALQAVAAACSVSSDVAAVDRAPGPLPLHAPIIVPVDVAQPDDVGRAWQDLCGICGGVDLVVYLAGHYEPLRAEQPSEVLLPALRRMLAVNLAGALEVVGRVAPALAARTAGPQSGRPGGIALVASVAGYRGLPLALGYGPTKAALIHLAEGLHLDLAPRGVGVWLINPGFVATRLTAGNAFEMPALLTPGEAAEAIVAGLASGCFEIHFPRRFTRVLKLLGLLPARLYLPLVRRLTRGGAG